jgi:predicted transposase YbfD/YdcC
VWASDFGLALAQAACDDKSNEIAAIPELLKLADLAGAIITIDATGAQKAIAKQIMDSQGDDVLALEGNQETLQQAVIDDIDQRVEKDFADADVRRRTTSETGHGREETRTYLQMPAPKDLPGFDLWKGLATIGLVVSRCLRNGQETVEARYDISSLSLDVKRFAHAVRRRWSIENSRYWSLDLTDREDESRLREKHLRENLAWLKRFSLSVLKQHPDKQSLVMKRRNFGWNDRCLMQSLTGKKSS